jgi:DNA-directed RNA polymerase subunit RPC12/RpoP
MTQDDSLHGMTCPKCGSPDWKEVPAATLFFTGVVMTGCGIWLVIILIGIPMILTGIALMAVGPFAKTAYRCTRCNKTWRLPKSAKSGA